MNGANMNLRPVGEPRLIRPLIHVEGLQILPSTSPSSSLPPIAITPKIVFGPVPKPQTRHHTMMTQRDTMTSRFQSISKSHLNRQKVYQCQKCTFWTIPPEEFHAHMISAHDPKKYHCSAPGCQYSTERISDMKKHCRTKNESGDSSHTDSRSVKVEEFAQEGYCKYLIYIVEKEVKPEDGLGLEVPVLENALEAVSTNLRSFHTGNPNTRSPDIIDAPGTSRRIQASSSSSKKSKLEADLTKSGGDILPPIKPVRMRMPKKSPRKIASNSNIRNGKREKQKTDPDYEADSKPAPRRKRKISAVIFEQPPVLESKIIVPQKTYPAAPKLRGFSIGGSPMKSFPLNRSLSDAPHSLIGPSSESKYPANGWKCKGCWFMSEKPETVRAHFRQSHSQGTSVNSGEESDENLMEWVAEVLLTPTNPKSSTQRKSETLDVATTTTIEEPLPVISAAMPKCLRCDFIGKDVTEVEIHAEEHDIINLTECEICNDFILENVLEDHIKTTHPNANTDKSGTKLMDAKSVGIQNGTEIVGVIEEHTAVKDEPFEIGEGNPIPDSMPQRLTGELALMCHDYALDPYSENKISNENLATEEKNVMRIVNSEDVENSGVPISVVGVTQDGEGDLRKAQHDDLTDIKEGKPEDLLLAVTNSGIPNEESKIDFEIANPGTSRPAKEGLEVSLMEMEVGNSENFIPAISTPNNTQGDEDVMRKLQEENLSVVKEDEVPNLSLGAVNNDTSTEGMTIDLETPSLANERSELSAVEVEEVETLENIPTNISTTSLPQDRVGQEKRLQKSNLPQKQHISDLSDEANHEIVKDESMIDPETKTEKTPFPTNKPAVSLIEVEKVAETNCVGLPVQECKDELINPQPPILDEKPDDVSFMVSESVNPPNANDGSQIQLRIASPTSPHQVSLIEVADNGGVTNKNLENVSSSIPSANELEESKHELKKEQDELLAVQTVKQDNISDRPLEAMNPGIPKEEPTIDFGIGESTVNEPIEALSVEAKDKVETTNCCSPSRDDVSLPGSVQEIESVPEKPQPQIICTLEQSTPTYLPDLKDEEMCEKRSHDISFDADNQNGKNPPKRLRQDRPRIKIGVTPLPTLCPGMREIEVNANRNSSGDVQLDYTGIVIDSPPEERMIIDDEALFRVVKKKTEDNLAQSEDVAEKEKNLVILEVVDNMLDWVGNPKNVKVKRLEEISGVKEDLAQETQNAFKTFMEPVSNVESSIPEERLETNSEEPVIQMELELEICDEPILGYASDLESSEDLMSSSQNDKTETEEQNLQEISSQEQALTNASDFLDKADFNCANPDEPEVVYEKLNPVSHGSSENPESVLSKSNIQPNPEKFEEPVDENTSDLPETSLASDQEDVLPQGAPILLPIVNPDNEKNFDSEVPETSGQRISDITAPNSKEAMIFAAAKGVQDLIDACFKYHVSGGPMPEITFENINIPLPPPPIIVRPQIFRCNQCPFHTEIQEVLASHLTHHPRDNIATLNPNDEACCDFCNFVCAKGDMAEHKKWHFFDPRRENITNYVYRTGPYEIFYEDNNGRRIVQYSSEPVEVVPGPGPNF